MSCLHSEPHRLVFLDETSVKTNLPRLRGRAPIGERLHGTVHFGKWCTQTFIAGLTSDELIAPQANKGWVRRLMWAMMVQAVAPSMVRSQSLARRLQRPSTSSG